MKYDYKLLLALVLLSISFRTQAQTRKAYEKAAAKYMASKDYFGAMRSYQHAIAFDSTKIDNIIGAADAAREFTAYSIAEAHYEHAIALDTAYQTDALFWLAYVENAQAKYDEAAQHYQMWLEHRDRSHPLYERAKLFLAHNDWALGNTGLDEKITVRNLGENINSPESDFAPARLGDDLYFSSLRFLYEKDKHRPKRYFSKLMISTNGAPAQKLDAPFNRAPDKHIGNLSFSKDGKYGYFTICENQDDGSIRCQIYMSTHQSDGSWGPAQALSSSINAGTSSNTQPQVAEIDGSQWLFFSSNRPGGKGGMDIWRAEMKGPDSFGSPENIEAVNTPLDEVSPYFDQESRTLYFSSNGHPGYGLFDVFRAKYKNDHWQEVTNLKKPVNSSYNDVYFSLYDHGRKALLASNRPTSLYIDDETQTCCNDIYELDIPVRIRLIVNTFNKLSKEALNGVRVTLMNMTDGTTDTVALQTDGSRYFFELEPGREYKVISLKNGYTGDSTLVPTKGIAGSRVIEKNLFLEPKIELLALTFDKITHTPLPKAGVRLIDLADNSKEQKVNDAGNDFHFALEYGKDYRVIAYRDGFSTDTVEFTTKGLPFEGKKITKKLYLEKEEGIYAALPIYYHNDEPDPGNKSTYSTVSYETSFRGYLARRQEYIRNYSAGLTGAAKQKAIDEVNRFFDDEVIKGYESLKRFAERLKLYMDKGKNATIVIKGFASPLAPDDYNYNLTKRRIDNVRKFLMELNGGILRSYFESGRIQVVMKPFGESKAPKGISDSPVNRRESVYNPRAARERRIEILRLKSSPRKDTL